MACEHPQINWVGTSDGIHCGLCGALVNIGALKKAEPKPEPEPKIEKEPEEAKPVKKPVLKRGAKK